MRLGKSSPARSPLKYRATLPEAAATSSIERSRHFSVSADRKHLTRAVQNVFRNCHRHAGEDCEVRIAAFKKDGVVTFDIGDNGSGVSDEEHSRLFEPFYRPDKSRTRDTGGIGLGMAIMESSVRACHGRIVAGRSPMGGLLISISLPEG